MWALRFLNGPQAGQIYPLKQGSNKLGRGSNCDLQIAATGVSKEHLEVLVVNGKILIRDLKSSNGTFVNGVRVQQGTLRMGDKLSLDQILFDVVPAVRDRAPQSLQVAAPGQVQSGALVPYAAQTPAVQMGQQLPGMPHPQDAMAGQMSGQMAAPSGEMPQVQLSFQQKIENYINEVVMPGLYRMVEVFEFRSVMMGFAIVFIFVVTLLSIIPMNQITSESIKTESRRRAITVARALANSNERAIRNGEMSGFNADLVLKDEGISHVYILAKDGSILAPPEMAGLTAKDIAGFVSTIKGQAKEFAAEVGGGKIAASCPILVFDPELSQNVAKAHAVVVYDTGSLKFDDGRALGLFVQMLAISLIVGTCLFFFMYKLIEYPFRRLHQELDVALREGKDHAQVEIKFPILQGLLIAINSLLTRIQQGSGGAVSSQASMSENEWVNLVQLVGYPAILLSKDLQIVSINPPFEELTGAQSHLVQGQAIAYLPDQAMQKNIDELVKLSQNNTQQLHTDKLDISGTNYRLSCQAITVSGEARFFLISIAQMAEGEAA